MREEQRELLNIMTSFKRLNIASILPDVRVSDFHILKMLGDKKENNVSMLVRGAQCPAPAVSRSLRNLEDKGYIERKTDRDDRRNTIVIITEKGENILKETDEIMTEFGEAVFGSFGEEKMKQLNKFLREILDTAQKEIDDRRTKKEKGETVNE